jgi:hypothetical protein
MDAQGIYEKLKAKGRAVSLRVGTGVFVDSHPETGDPGTEGTVNHATYALELETTFAERQALAKILGSDVAMKDKRLMVAAIGIKAGETALSALPLPTTAMKLVDGSTVYNIVNAEGLRPAQDVYYYSVQVRGA